MKTQAQRDRQINLMEAARGAAAKRAEAKRVAAQAEADRAAAEAAHVHHYGNWEYVLNYSHEVSQCKCGYAQMRPVRPL